MKIRTRSADPARRFTWLTAVWCTSPWRSPGQSGTPPEENADDPPANASAEDQGDDSGADPNDDEGDDRVDDQGDGDQSDQPDDGYKRPGKI